MNDMCRFGGGMEIAMKKLISAFLSVILLLLPCLLVSCDGLLSDSKPIEATVTLNGDSIQISDASAGTVEGSDLTIVKGGTYTVTGTLNDGRIIVSTDKETNVTLILQNASLSCSDSAPIYIKSAKNCYINLAEGSVNTVTDGETYVYANALETEPNAAIFSKCDLFFEGSGTLTVQANYNNGVVSKDDLTVRGGNLNVTAKNNGLKGKDSVVIEDGNLEIESVGDAIKSNKDTDPAKGYVRIEGGTLVLKAGDEGIQGKTNVTINGGTITIEAEGNGIKADSNVMLNGGEITITAGSDGVDAPQVTGSATVNGEKITY